MQRVIVTGSEGFVASHTIKELEFNAYEEILENKYDVIRYDLKLGQDVCDYNQLSEVVQEGDKIIHLAAVARFSDADKDPAETYRTNVGGTNTVLRVARDKKAERVVYSSTGSALMPIWHNPIREDTSELRGNSVYGFSKAEAERQFQLYPEVSHVILRYGHLYGEGKIGHGAINSFLERMQRGLKPIIFGGNQSNEFCYIKDIVQANLLALETENINEVYNIGYGEDFTIQHVYEVINKISGTNIEAEYGEARIVDAPFFRYDISKARRLLGYEPKWSLEDGIRDMIEGSKLTQGKEER